MMRATMAAMAGLASASRGSDWPASAARVSSGSIGIVPRCGTLHAAAMSRAPLELEQKTCHGREAVAESDRVQPQQQLPHCRKRASVCANSSAGSMDYGAAGVSQNGAAMDARCWPQAHRGLQCLQHGGRDVHVRGALKVHVTQWHLETCVPCAGR